MKIVSEKQKRLEDRKELLWINRINKKLEILDNRQIFKMTSSILFSILDKIDSDNFKGYMINKVSKGDIDTVFIYERDFGRCICQMIFKDGECKTHNLSNDGIINFNKVFESIYLNYKLSKELNSNENNQKRLKI